MFVVVSVSIIETVLNVSESEPTVEVCLELTNAAAKLLRPLVFYIFSVNDTALSEFYNTYSGFTSRETFHVQGGGQYFHVSMVTVTMET